MKGILGVLIGAVAVILIIIAFTSTNEDVTEIQLGNNEGRVFFGITDDTADIQAVNEIYLEIEKIEMYSSTDGWVTAASNSENYPLLALKANGTIALHSVGAVESGLYERIKVTLGDVVVDNKTRGTVAAYLPSTEVTYDVAVRVEEGEDSHVTLDYLADQSLHTTVDGEYVFAPVVEIETRSNANVEVTNGEKVTVTGGSVDTKATIGVDLDGIAKTNFTLDSNSGLDVESSSTGNVTFTLGDKVFTGSSASLNSNSNEEGSVQMNQTTDTNMDIDSTVDTSATSQVNVNADLASTTSIETEGRMELEL